MHIVRIANFVSPTSGGIKTALREWGQVYRARGHQVSLVIPGPGEPESEEPQGRIYRVGALPVGSSGYSLIWKRSEITALLDRLQPDSIEVSDRSTLRWTGAWARKNGVGSIMISHENLTGIMDRRTPVPAKPAHFLANVVNGRSAKAYDMIVAPSEYSAQEFHRMGVPAEVVPLGVDLETFAPGAPRPPLDGRPAHIIHCGRLSPEKNPQLSIKTMEVLLQRGHDVEMTVLGHGPMRDELIGMAQDLPIKFHAYITDRAELAHQMTLADAAIAPGPVETFGLAALEALACGVPTVCPVEGALGEVVGEGGLAARSHPGAFADAITALLNDPAARTAARDQAEHFTWEASADHMLAVHELVSSMHR